MLASRVPRIEHGRTWMGAFLAALRFLTVLPVPGESRLDEEAWSQATAWYPAVGLVVGLVLAGLDWIVGRLWPAGVSTALVLAVWVVLTGALHLDGFVDCCDALWAPVSKERRLEILRDVHVGAYGVVGATLLLLLKYSALLAVPATFRLPVLLLVPVLGRWSMTAAVVGYPYARLGPGLGQKAKAEAGRRQLTLATTLTLVAALVAWVAGLGWLVLPSAFMAVLTLWAVAGWIRSKLGGLTGDGYGAICEVVEVVGLLTVVAFAFGGVGP